MLQLSSLMAGRIDNRAATIVAIARRRGYACHRQQCRPSIVGSSADNTDAVLPGSYNPCYVQKRTGRAGDHAREGGTVLILARKTGEAIAIGDSITIKVLEVKNGQVKIGVEAPADVMVHREEIYLRIMEENRKAAMEAPADLSSLSSVFSGDRTKNIKPPPAGRN